MNFYERLIENPLFFKWIYHASPEINAYWKHFLRENPEHAPQILKIKSQFEKYLKYKEEFLSEEEKKALAKRIIQELEKNSRPKKRSIVFRRVMRYAAIAFLFFGIGSSLVYLYMRSRQPEFVVDNSALPAQVQDPVLIIGDTAHIRLNEGKTELQYNPRGKITLNRKQTIKKEAVNEKPEINTLVIPYGSRSTVTLADGSRIWLNAGSRLIYPSRFVERTREVFLSGEAFFEVAENPGKTFVVRTMDVKVQVTGTRFNVSAYPEDYSVQTVLAEGAVEIKRAQGGLFDKVVELQPGNLAYFNKKTKKTRTYKVDVDNYTLWTEGLFSFSQTDFSRIVKKLERYYNIRFQFDDPFKGSIQISGKLDVTQERREVFEYLERLTGLKFVRINGKHYLIR